MVNLIKIYKTESPTLTMFNRNLFVLLLFFSMLHHQNTLAQTQINSEKNAKIRSSELKHDAIHFYKIGLNLMQAPTEFKSKDWQYCGLIAGKTALLFLADKEIRNFSKNNQNKNNDQLFYIDHYHGNVYTAILASGTYGLGYFLKNENIRQMGLHSMEAFVYAGLFTATLQVVFGRRRPYGGENNLVFKPFYKKTKYNGLPSGHTTVAFAVSTVMAKSLDNIVWKTFWYTNAGLVGAARIYHNKHWVSDVFLGGVIGYTIANYIVNFQTDKIKHRTSHIFPYIHTNEIGIRLYF